MTKEGLRETKNIIKRKIDETIEGIKTKWGSEGPILQKTIQNLETKAKQDQKTKEIMNKIQKQNREFKKIGQQLLKYLNKKYKTNYNFQIYTSIGRITPSYHFKEQLMKKKINELNNLKDKMILELTENTEDINTILNKLNKNIEKIVQ